MGEHDHVAVVDPVRLGPVLVLPLADESPVRGEVLQCKEVLIKLHYLHLPVCLVNRLACQFVYHFVGILVAEDDINGLEADGARSCLTLREEIEQNRLFIAVGCAGKLESGVLSRRVGHVSVGATFTAESWCTELLSAAKRRPASRLLVGVDKKSTSAA